MRPVDEDRGVSKDSADAPVVRGRTSKPGDKAGRRLPVQKTGRPVAEQMKGGIHPGSCAG